MGFFGFYSFSPKSYKSNIYIYQCVAERVHSQEKNRKNRKTLQHKESQPTPPKEKPEKPKRLSGQFLGFSTTVFISQSPETTQPRGFSVFRVFRRGYRRGCGSFQAQTPAGNANRDVYLGIGFIKV